MAGFKFGDECEKCDGRPVIRGECQVCGYYHAKTYSDWIDHVGLYEDDEDVPLEERLDREGYLIIDSELHEEDE